MSTGTATVGRGPNDYLFDVKASDYRPSDVVAQLHAFGFAALRNLFDPDMIVDINARAENVLEHPSIGGSVGYYMKDYPKKTYDALLLGGPTVDLITDERVIDIAEDFIGGTSLLSEVFLKHDIGVFDVYFPPHRDFEAGREISDKITITQEIMDKPFSAGSMVYLHDTREGAFCYSAGSHNVSSEHGSSPEGYPPAMLQQIIQNMVRVEGLAGDLVIFDDRGFHGPEQPVKSSRRVIIFDHFRRDVFANTTKGPVPAFLNDLGHLNQRQLNFLGLGAGTMRSHDGHHIHHFNRQKGYPMAARLFEGYFALERLKRRVRNKLKGFPPSYLPSDF
jgi:hypothetical protein